MALLTKHPEITSEGSYRDIFANWGQTKSVAGAMSAIEGISSMAWRREAIDGLAETLGERNLDAAMEWATRLPNPGDRDHALRKALEQNLNRDPQRVAAEWAQIEGTTAKTELAEQLARGLVAAGSRRRGRLGQKNPDGPSPGAGHQPSGGNVGAPGSPARPGAH